MQDEEKKSKNTFDFTVDAAELTTSEHELTPNQILALAGIDASTHYLVQIVGREQHSYQGVGDQQVHIHEGMKFISVFTGPTPVSWYGA